MRLGLPSSWGADLLDLLLPAGCIACGDWIPTRGQRSLVCARCRTKLRAATWPRCPRCHFPRGARRVDAPDCIECREWSPDLTAARYCYVLEHPADDLVHALKYEGWPELAESMGRDMARLQLPARAAEDGSLVVPVPTTAKRLRSRGYNQAELLAAEVAGRLRLPLCRALVRVSDGCSQTALTPTERRQNVRGVFAPTAEAPSLRDAAVLLVDDVLTTGATASEAASALVGMGARSVTLLAYARALPKAAC